ncbi:MAG: hypothetical protein RBQ91_02815 [Acholeplasma sp.]|nr:hypothetical protein [Acholeplasma sp.]
MNGQKIWGLEYNMVLLIGWLLPLVLNIPGLIVVIILRSYFKNTERIDFLTEGYTEVSNVMLTVLVGVSLFGIGMMVFGWIPILGALGMLFGSLIVILLVIYWIYVSIKGALEATKGIIHRPVFKWMFIK